MKNNDGKGKKKGVLGLLEKLKKAEESVEYPKQLQMERKSWFLWEILKKLLGLK